MLSKVIKKLPDLNDYQYLISGTVGESVMYDFFTFTNLFFNLPSIKQIINKESIKIPDESPKKYAIIQHIIEEITEDDLDNVAYFIDKFPGEFKALFLKKIANKFKDLMLKLTEPKFKNIKELYVDL